MKDEREETVLLYVLAFLLFKLCWPSLGNKTNR